MVKIYGDLLDDQTRCQHYHSERDIIALKCFACRRYYPCYKCHDAAEDHAFGAYPTSRTADAVVYCGACRTELTLGEYLDCSGEANPADGDFAASPNLAEEKPACPYCASPFNPSCRRHAAIYFRKEDSR